MRLTIFNRISNFGLEDLDSQRKILQRESKHLWKRMILKLGIVLELREKVEGETFLNSTGSTTSLGGVTFGNPALDEFRDLSFFVESEERSASSVSQNEDDLKKENTPSTL